MTSTTGSQPTLFRAPVAGGEVVGHVGGQGPELLLLHGGPVSDYLGPLAEELRGAYRVATYQQRGLPPSLAQGPYDVATHLADVVAVLDHLGWQRAIVGGHSWGGHLLLHLIADHPDRLRAALVIDPMGGVGDGGYAEFDAEMFARLPEQTRERAAELDARFMAGEGTPEDAVESMRLVWPAYFPSPDRALAMPDDLRVNPEMTGLTLQSAHDELPGLAPRLASSPVPTVFVHGAKSPMPVSASADTVEVMGEHAVLDLVPDAGHFVWLDVPGCLHRALADLVARSADR